MNEIVAAVVFEGSVFIFSRSGKVYEMTRNFAGDPQFRVYWLPGDHS